MQLVYLFVKALSRFHICSIFNYNITKVCYIWCYFIPALEFYIYITIYFKVVIRHPCSRFPKWFPNAMPIILKSNTLSSSVKGNSLYSVKGTSLEFIFYFLFFLFLNLLIYQPQLLIFLHCVEIYYCS